MILIIFSIVVLFVSFLIYKDPTIVTRSISYSYYEDRETAVVWGSFAGVMGMIILFAFPSILTLIAGICLTLVPIAGDFNRVPIKYIHYTLAAGFYFFMFLYTGSFTFAVPYAIVTLLFLYMKHKTLSMFWLEIIGILIILMNLY